MPEELAPNLPPAIPYELELNTAMQTTATILLWVGTIGLLLYAIKMAREERSIFPVVLVLAVAAGSIFEPIYDIAYHLHWLDAGEQWTLFTSFGLPQPVWVMPAYVVVFAVPALFLYRTLVRQASMEKVFRYAALTAFTTWLFETIAVNVDLYVYYGEAPWRIWNYPTFIAFMESAQITGFAVLAALLKLKATKPIHCLALFALFPANFAFDVMGAGFPVLIPMNSSADPNGAILFFGAALSVVFAYTCLWWSTKLLLTLQGRERIVVPDTAKDPSDSEPTGQA